MNRRALGGVLAALLAMSGAAGAQQRSVVRVRDDAGAGVPYALVRIGAADARIADSTGVLQVRAAEDSLMLTVLRIGHREHRGWVRRVGDAYEVTLPRVAASLSTVEVSAAGSTANAPLVARGFYDRVDRVQRGAILGDFFSPEALDERPFSQVSQMIAGSRYGRVDWVPVKGVRKPVIVGRGGCRMTILLDGDKVSGTIQEEAPTQVPQSIVPAGTAPISGESGELSIDEVVDGRSVMAIEIYPSAGNAPFELVRGRSRGSCGIVALWTGGRR